MHTPSSRTPRPARPPQEPGERLAKRVAQQVPCSRREAEQYIEGGWVRVDGTVVEEPQCRVLPHQTVTLDAHASLLDLRPVTLLLHKPAGLSLDQARAQLTTAQHWPHDPSGTPVLQRHFKHLECTLALENGASGLLVFTQDWRVTRKLTDTLQTLEHELMAEVAGELQPEDLAPLQRILKAPHTPLPATQCSLNSSKQGRSKLRFAIKGAHPGLVAHLCATAGFELLALHRIRLGRVALRDVPPGQWRYLHEAERL